MILACYIYVTDLISYFPCDKLYLLKIAGLSIKSCHSLPCTVDRDSLPKSHSSVHSVNCLCDTFKGNSVDLKDITQFFISYIELPPGIRVYLLMK